MNPQAVWSFRLVYALVAAGILFFSLLPFGSGEGGMPGPELILCLTLAWVLRRPDYVPIWLLVPVLLLEDALFMRPLGVWTLVTFLASEYLRRRVDQSEAMPFLAEARIVAMVIAVAFAANHLVLILLVAEPPPVLGQALHALATIVFYPAVAVFSQMIGVRRLAPGELDTLGSRA